MVTGRCAVFYETLCITIRIALFALVVAFYMGIMCTVASTRVFNFSVSTRVQVAVLSASGFCALGALSGTLIAWRTLILVPMSTSSGAQLFGVPVGVSVGVSSVTPSVAPSSVAPVASDDEGERV